MSTTPPPLSAAAEELRASMEAEIPPDIAAEPEGLDEVMKEIENVLDSVDL